MTKVMTGWLKVKINLKSLPLRILLKNILEEGTVNSEIFVRILFSRIALKDISALLKFRDLSMICLYQ